jgi:hypothetical protein
VSEVHIAGLALRVGNVARQRCAWCGVVLLEHDLENTFSMSSDGKPAEPGFWEQNRLVEIDGNAQWVRPEPEGSKLPVNCCAIDRTLRVVRGELDA